MSHQPLRASLHERGLQLAAMAVDYELTSAETNELATHLATCPSCARRAAALRADAGALSEPLTLLPSARVDAAVYAAIARRPARPQRVWVLAAAAALLLLALLGALATGAYLLRNWQILPITVVPSPSAPVAVISPQPDASTARSAEPDPSIPPVIGESWQGIDLPASDVGEGWIGLMESVTATETGFVAVGRPVCVDGQPEPTNCHASVWTAAYAGGGWTRAPDQPGLEMVWGASPSGPEVGLFDVARGPAGLVAIGWDAQGPGAWHSPDGRTWERVKVAFGSSPEDALSYRIAAVAGGLRGYVIVGYVVKDGPTARAAAWTSLDGVSWTRAEDTADMNVGACGATGEEPDCGGMRSATATGSGFVAVGQARAGKGASKSLLAAWTSGDGLSWQRADFSGDESKGQLSGVTASRLGLVAVGGSAERGLAATSVDGSQWSVTPVDSTALQDVASTGEEVFALGVTNPDVEPRAELQLWRSADGAIWQRVPTLPSVPDAYSYYNVDLAATLDRAVVIGRAGVIEVSGADVFRNFSYVSP